MTFNLGLRIMKLLSGIAFNQLLLTESTRVGL